MAFESSKWTVLPEPNPVFFKSNDGFHCNFTENFSFEIIVYGEKMEQSIEKLKKYIDESYVGSEREMNSVNLSYNASFQVPEETREAQQSVGWINRRLIFIFRLIVLCWRVMKEG